MMSTNTDYVTKYFEYPTLTKIHGKPLYEPLKEMKNQIRPNGPSVTSDIGGVVNGHLGLICTAAEYMLVYKVPYLVPEHPGVLDKQVGTSQHEAVNQRKHHKLSLRLFKEIVDVQKSLIKQLVQAIEPNYLSLLRNRTTTTITASV